MDDAIQAPLAARAPWTWVACACALLAGHAHAQTAAAGPPPIAAAAPVDPAAFAAADAAYKAYEQGRHDVAVEQARRAVQLAPQHAPYARLLMFALAAAGRPGEAEEAASRVLGIDPQDTQALAERGRLRMARGDVAGARADYEAALASPGASAAQRVGFLFELGRQDEARREFQSLAARAREVPGATASPTEMELAYLAGRIGESQAALEGFRRADANGRLPESALRDAAYAAVRAGENEQAVHWFRRAIDASDAGRARLADQERYETRRSITELQRRFGAFASLNYRASGGVTPGFGVVPDAPASSSWQAGAEAWWRPFGQHNGRHAELFVRSFETLSSSDGPTGANSRQVGIGARVKPLTTENLVLSVSRTDTRAEAADWLLQAGYSADRGTDLRLDRASWPTFQLSGEVGRYLRRDQTYAVASVRAGRSFNLREGDAPTTVFPHGVLAAEYDSLAARRHASAAGVGVTVRQWFGSGRYEAPRSYADFTVQYRARLSGDSRAKGVYFTALLAL